MNDGNTSFWNGGIGNKSWKVPKTCSELYHSNSIQQVIIIAICPNDREYEYTHTYWLPTRNYGGVEEYALFLIELKKWVDENYRTLGSPDKNMIIGSSHGGLASFFIGLNHPDVWGNVASLSPSFWAGMGVVENLLCLHEMEESELMQNEKIVETLESMMNGGRRSRIWLSWGMNRGVGLHNFFY